MRLILVRHGQTSSNISGALDTGRPGAPLSALGHEQAQALAQRWDEFATAPSAIGVSPLTRTRQTAQPLLQRFQMEPMVLSGLREVRGGNLEMSASLADIAHYMKAMLPWIQGNYEARMPGGESGKEILARALPAVAQVLTKAHDLDGDDATAVIVAHGAINRIIASALSPQIGANLVMMYRLDNCGTCVLRAPQGFVPGRAEELVNAFTAETWNDTSMSEWDVPEELHIAVKY